MVVDDAYVFPGFLSPVLTQLFFPKPPTTFPTCFCRGERQKYARKKSRLNQGSNSQPPGHEFDTLNTELPRHGAQSRKRHGQGKNLKGRVRWELSRYDPNVLDASNHDSLFIVSCLLKLMSLL